MIRIHHALSPPDPAGTGLQPASDGRMWFEERFRGSLEQAGLDSFEAVMRTSSGRCIRVLSDRESWYFRLRDAHQPRCGVFLKRHHLRTSQSRWRAWCGVGPGETAGRVEAQNVRRLTEHGIPVMRLVAYGERLHDSGLEESFVLTEELAGYAELQDFLQQRFKSHGASPTARRDGDLVRLIQQVASIVRRFHDAGFNHRDLYCCHFFVKEPAKGEFEVRLIDLQRVQWRRRFRRRWIVKDLAQLAWSTPHNHISCTQRLAFMRQYLGVRRLRPKDRRLIRQVLAKQQSMTRRLGVAQ